MSVPTEEGIRIGGAERDRTVDLLNAIQALSQLSYSPTLSDAASPKAGKHSKNFERVRYHSSPSVTEIDARTTASGSKAVGISDRPSCLQWESLLISGLDFTPLTASLKRPLRDNSNPALLSLLIRPDG